MRVPIVPHPSRHLVLSLSYFNHSGDENTDFHPNPVMLVCYVPHSIDKETEAGEGKPHTHPGEQQVAATGLRDSCAPMAVRNVNVGKLGSAKMIAFLFSYFL